MCASDGDATIQATLPLWKAPGIKNDLVQRHAIKLPLMLVENNAYQR